MDLAIGVADIDIVVVDQRDFADAGARAGLGRPGTYAADADDAEMRSLQCAERFGAENAAEAVKSLQVFLAQHLLIF
jgi:hypothetical protein